MVTDPNEMKAGFNLAYFQSIALMLYAQWHPFIIATTLMSSLSDKEWQLYPAEMVAGSPHLQPRLQAAVHGV
jgi:hypothetical protein